MLEALEILAFAPLLAIPAAVGAAGAGGIAGILPAISGVLSGLPLIGGLFKKKSSGSGGVQSMADFGNAVHQQQLAAVDMITTLQGKAKTNKMIIIGLSVLVALAGLVYLITKKK